MREQHTGRRQEKKQSVIGRYLAWRRDWIANMTRGQRIRHRLLQAAVAVSILIIAVWAVLNAWIRPPALPGSNRPNVPGDTSGDISGIVDWDVETPDVAKRGRQEGVYTFLLVGQDTGGGGNTDTMILFTYDTKAKTVHGMNLPRDTMVNVSTSSKRLNAVYNYNKGRDKDTQVEKGMAALKKEVGKLTGIVPDYYVIIQWEAVGELVDTLGGVYFDVPFDMDYDDPYQDLYIHQEAGYRKLTGDDAMQVVRWRKNNTGPSGGDVARISIQQDFLKAVAKQCLQPSVLLKAPALAQVFMNNVTTDLELGHLLYFAQQAFGMDAEEGVVLNTMPWTDAKYPSVSMVLPIKDQLLEMLNDGMNPYLDEIQSSDLQLLYRNSDGSYGVTSGTLADAKLANPRSSTSSSTNTQKPEDTTPPEEETPEEPEQTPETGTEQPGEAQPGEEPGEQSPGQGEPEDPESGGVTDPDDGQTSSGGQTASEGEGQPQEGQTGGQTQPTEDLEGVPEWMIPVVP